MYSGEVESKLMQQPWKVQPAHQTVLPENVRHFNCAGNVRDFQCCQWKCGVHAWRNSERAQSTAEGMVEAVEEEKED